MNIDDLNSSFAYGINSYTTDSGYVNSMTIRDKGTGADTVLNFKHGSNVSAGIANKIVDWASHSFGQTFAINYSNNVTLTKKACFAGMGTSNSGSCPITFRFGPYSFSSSANSIVRNSVILNAGTYTISASSGSFPSGYSGYASIVGVYIE